MSIKNNILYTFLHSLRYIYWLLFQPNTYGVRILFLYKKEILLIKHSYRPEYYIPGGGVKKGETFKNAAIRESYEEVGIKDIDNSLKYFGTYESKEEGKNDVVCVFLCYLKEKQNLHIDNKEIVSANFYKLKNLPSGISKATMRRVTEYRKQEYPLLGKW